MAGRKLHETKKTSPKAQAGLVKAKSDLGDIISRRKTSLNSTMTTFPTASKASKRMTVEEDAGFVFQRKKQPAIAAPAILAAAPSKAPVSKQSTLSSNEPVADAKNKMAAIRRRKSSIGGLKGAASSRRQSSFGIGLSQKLPPVSVNPSQYYKHLLPDLPGPVKMRQLMVWAVQKTLQSYRKKATVEPIAECLLQGLLKNELETSWYGRPTTVSGSTAASVKQHPQNVELLDTISQVRQYHNQYEYTNHNSKLYCRLQQELSKWQSFEQSALIPPPIINQQSDDINDQIITNLQSISIVSDLQQATTFIRSLPLSVDHLDWSVRIAGTFADRSKDFCEDIFRQIFARFFSDDATTPPVDPLLVLKALSSKAQQSAGQRRQSAVMSALQSRRKSLAAVMEY